MQSETRAVRSQDEYPLEKTSAAQSSPADLTHLAHTKEAAYHGLDETLPAASKLNRASDQVCMMAVIVVDLVLLAEVLGPWPRAMLVMLYVPSGLFLQLCSLLCWVGARACNAGSERDLKTERRAAFAVWAMFGLAFLFFFEAHFYAAAGGPSPFIIPTPGTQTSKMWSAYVALLCELFAASVVVIVRAATRTAAQTSSAVVLLEEGRAT